MPADRPLLRLGARKPIMSGNPLLASSLTAENVDGAIRRAAAFANARF
jgi:hypothetical protein